MEAEGVDWESVRTKYDITMEMVYQNYPKTDDIKEFPRGECIQELHKAFITSKTKKICSDYKKAVDLGKRRGGGRIIMNFYDLCQDMWAGSPATTCLSSRFDSSMVSEDSTVEVEKELYHIDYIPWYIFIRNHLKM